MVTLPADCVGAWISTPHGIRRLQANEVCWALGVPKETLLHPSGCTTRDLQHTTGIFKWEALSPMTQGKLPSPTERAELQQVNNQEVPSAALGRSPSSSTSPTAPLPLLELWPLDLTPGSRWHQTRVANLHKAARTCGDQAESLQQEGMKMLATHRGTMAPQDPH